MNKIKLIAHRGGYLSSSTRENSKEAIEYASKQDYIDGIEFDVRITKDKKAVIIHNSAFKIGRKKYYISQHKYQELNELYKNEFGTELATLEEILMTIPKNKKIFLEVKNMNIKKAKHQLDIIYKIIKKYPSKQIIVISFLYNYLKYFKSKDYKVGLLLSKNSHFFEIKTYFHTYLSLNLDMITMDKRIINPKNSRRVLKRHKLLGIYTIEKAEEIPNILKSIDFDNIKDISNVYITTSNPKAIYERLEQLYEENKKI